VPRQSVSPTWKLPRKRPEGAQLRVRRHSDTEAVASRSAHLPSIVDVKHEGRVFNAVNCQCRKRTRVSDVRAKQGGVPVMAQQIYRDVIHAASHACFGHHGCGCKAEFDTVSPRLFPRPPLQRDQRVTRRVVLSMPEHFISRHARQRVVLLPDGDRKHECHFSLSQ